VRSLHHLDPGLYTMDQPMNTHKANSTSPTDACGKPIQQT
jgi:hypothetical protein